MPKAQPIPTTSRNKVRSRDAAKCFRCRMPTRPGQWSHRRGRSVRDGHENCPANGLWACAHDHRWLHANPVQAREMGWLVWRHEDPHDVPVNIAGRWYTLGCDGTKTEIRYRNEREATMRDLRIDRSPIPGSPRMGYYVIDNNDPDFELGPFHFHEGATEALVEELSESECGEPTEAGPCERSGGHPGDHATSEEVSR